MNAVMLSNYSGVNIHGFKPEFVKSLLMIIKKTIVDSAKHDCDVYADFFFDKNNNCLTVTFFYRTLTGRITLKDYDFIQALTKNINSFRLTIN